MSGAYGSVKEGGQGLKSRRPDDSRTGPGHSRRLATVDTATWAAIGIAGVGAVANWWSRLRHDDRVEAWSKPLVTIAMIAAALTIHASPSSARVWFALGLVACLLGDVALLPAVDRFIVGLGAFWVGHAIFCIGALTVGVHRAWTVVPVVALSLGVGVFAGPRIVRGSGSLAPAVALYLGVIVVMAVLVGATGRIAGMVGAMAFVVSDGVLGWNRFVREERWANVTVMMTYHLALAGLVMTLL